MVRRLDSWDPLSVMLTIMLSAAIGFVAWLFNEQIKDNAFRARGGRFSVQDGAQLEHHMKEYFDERFPPPWLLHRLDDIQREQRRLQCGQDVLEGRDCLLDGLDWHGVPPMHPRERIVASGDG